jgi:hypothetical protein
MFSKEIRVISRTRFLTQKMGFELGVEFWREILKPLKIVFHPAEAWNWARPVGARGDS